MSVIAFRVDASLQIGTGHVMRCLTLADVLRERGALCCFVSRPHQGHLFELIVQRGYQVLALPELQEVVKPNLSGSDYAHWLGADWTIDAQDTEKALSARMGGDFVDWLIVDHYGLDARWEETFRTRSKHIMVIDDLADRPHFCDLLLDQNLGRKAQDYDGLLKGDTKTLIGPQYALLRPEFASLRSQSLARREGNPELRRLLITMGGVDKDNVTGQVLDVLKACSVPPELLITVVMGSYAPWLAQVQTQATEMSWHTEVLVGVSNMAQLMVSSDLAIGAAGSTSWERCCMGLPTIQIVLAQNQELIAHALSNVGAAFMLRSEEITEQLPKIINAITEPNRMRTMAKVCSFVTQGRGAILVSDYMKNWGIL